MRCCQTHDGIDFAADCLRQALSLPNLQDDTRKWLEQKLVETVERSAILVQNVDGSFHARLIPGQSTPQEK